MWKVHQVTDPLCWESTDYGCIPCHKQCWEYFLQKIWNYYEKCMYIGVLQGVDLYQWIFTTGCHYARPPMKCNFLDIHGTIYFASQTNTPLLSTIPLYISILGVKCWLCVTPPKPAWGRSPYTMLYNFIWCYILRPCCRYGNLPCDIDSWVSQIWICMAFWSV